MHDCRRDQTKIHFQCPFYLRGNSFKHYLKEVNGRANNDEPFHPPRERWKAQRHCASAIHSVASVGVSCQQGITPKPTEDTYAHLIRLCGATFTAPDPRRSAA